MANALAQEKSPYLLQHAQNPVDWLPWGEEAFARAREEDKPVFLSIGYATCHWCHVMAHESFEDEDVAQALNRDFVCIKVDREERPDIDGIYMSVCQALTGSGGWPLSLFLTPEKKPFFAGTYFPKTAMMGRPGFIELLAEIARLWRQERAKLLEAGEKVTRALQARPQGEAVELDQKVLEKAYWQFVRSFDQKRGGFGQAPKFPTPHHLNFLLRWHRMHPDSQALEMTEKTLRAMRDGGIFDQVGLGFHRYSVDERWLVPHFEKMLYDQALLALAYVEAFQVSADEYYAQAARNIFTYVLRDMTSPQGGFLSAEDADSEGEEGLFYVWTPDQVKEILGPEQGPRFCAFYDITEAGNFEKGRSIPWVTRDIEAFARQRDMDPAVLEAELARGRELLFEARQKRVPPLKDDKVLTAWNGLMIAALAKGYQVLGDESYLRAGARAAEFILKELSDDQGRLMRRWRQGEAANPGYLDDYAFLVWGLIELYLAGLDPAHLKEAMRLNGLMLDLFWDDLHNGLFYTPHHAEDLIIRDKEIYDGALPSGNSAAALNLIRLARLIGNSEWEKRAAQIFRSFSAQVAQHPMAYTLLLCALDAALAQEGEVVLAGSRDDPALKAMLRTLQTRFAPGRVWLLRPQGDDVITQLAPYTEQMGMVEGQTAAYVCKGFSCSQPMTGLREFQAALA